MWKYFFLRGLKNILKGLQIYISIFIFSVFVYDPPNYLQYIKVELYFRYEVYLKLLVLFILLAIGTTRLEKKSILHSCFLILIISIIIYSLLLFLFPNPQKNDYIISFYLTMGILASFQFGYWDDRNKVYGPYQIKEALNSEILKNEYIIKFITNTKSFYFPIKKKSKLHSLFNWTISYNDFVFNYTLPIHSTVLYHFLNEFNRIDEEFLVYPIFNSIKINHSFLLTSHRYIQKDSQTKKYVEVLYEDIETYFIKNRIKELHIIFHLKNGNVIEIECNEGWIPRRDIIHFAKHIREHLDK